MKLTEAQRRALQHLSDYDWLPSSRTFIPGRGSRLVILALERKGLIRDERIDRGWREWAGPCPPGVASMQWSCSYTAYALTDAGTAALAAGEGDR